MIILDISESRKKVILIIYQLKLFPIKYIVKDTNNLYSTRSTCEFYHTQLQLQFTNLRIPKIPVATLAQQSAYFLKGCLSTVARQTKDISQSFTQ